VINDEGAVMSLKIHGSRNNPDVYLETDITGWLGKGEQRELISWFWKNEPELVREIVCKDCPSKKVQ